MKQVTQEQFTEMRDTLNRTEKATKIVPISSINMTSDSLRKGKIEIGGVPVGVSDSFFHRLASMLKLNRSFTSEFMKNSDDKIAVHLINALKDYRAQKGKGEVMLIANPNTKLIVDICAPKNFRKISNDTVFDITERLLNDTPSLMIETIDVDPYTNNVSVNLLNNQEVGFAQAGKDEFFKFGFSIVQTNRDTYAESYNQRLVCSNGLRVSLGQGAIGGNRELNFSENFRLGGTSAEEIKIFLNKIGDMEKAGFVPTAFGSTLNRAVETKASLLEVENAMRKSQSMLVEIDPDLKKIYNSSIADQYFPGYSRTMARIVQKGQDPMRLGEKQKSFVKTGMSIWDVVNSLTFLGSNNSGFELNGKAELKQDAGTLFAKGTRAGYDLEFAQYANL
jgi:hypothetical protein